MGFPPPTSVSGSFEIAANGSAVENLDPAGASKIPPEWRAVISRAMAPLPQARYSDARSMREAIDALSSAPPSAIQPTMAEADGVGTDSVGTKVETEVRKTNVSK